MSEVTNLIKEADSCRVQIAPKYVRVPDAEIITGFKRTKLLSLAKKGKIISLSLREPGMDKAVRLFEVASLESYIRRFFPKGKAAEPRMKEVDSHRVEIAPKYVRIPDAELMCGLKRSTLLSLAAKGRIASLSLREPGMSKGVRLFEVASLESYIRSFLPKGKEVA